MALNGFGNSLLLFEIGTDRIGQFCNLMQYLLDLAVRSKAQIETCV
jgi:hypothetical protein